MLICAITCILCKTSLKILQNTKISPCEKDTAFVFYGYLIFFSFSSFFFFFFPFVCNVKSFANVIVVCLQLLWVFFSVNFLDGQPKFIHDTCDQDRTCFQGHTGKCFRLCSVGFYSKRGWPTLTWYLCGTQDTPRNCFACSSSVG